MFKTISPSESLDDDVDYNLTWLKDTIHEAATRHGHKWVLIDPWNEIEHWWSNQDTEATYLNRALRMLKKFVQAVWHRDGRCCARCARLVHGGMGAVG